MKFSIFNCCSLSFCLALLAACSHAPLPPETNTEVTQGDSKGGPGSIKSPPRKATVISKRGGGYYKDDGPADDIPEGLDDIPDAEPKWEPLHKPATRPYVVLGKEYVPFSTLRPYRAKGIASWYGKKFHGQKTSIGEPYDMFAMTAAHTVLPLPSYARVTHLQSGKSVIVRVTDRGPFHADRIIDLSYTAAYKLGLVNGGSGMVEVEAILPGETNQLAAQQTPAPRQADPVEKLMALEAKNNVQSPPPLPGKGIYIQLGAFANRENAENLRNHLTRELEWLNEPVAVYPGENVHRVQVGPFQERRVAEATVNKIQTTLGYKPGLVVR